MISLLQLNKLYQCGGQDIVALKNINLQVSQGEIFGVVGKSGAGKSTLIRCVNLLERPTSGSIRVAGQDLTGLSAAELVIARRQIGMIFQHFNLLESATVFDNIALPLVLAGQSKKTIVNHVLPLLELVELADKMHHYPSELSGGQKQRVAIARALANKPKVLLCDEATSALDPQTTKSILRLLDNINQQMGLTILLITHEMEVVKQICDRVGILEKGEIVEQATTTDFFIKPKTVHASALSQAALNHELPNVIQQQLILHPVAGSNPLLRILFQGERVQEPLISDVVHHFGLEINILQANIELIHKQALGIMIVEVFNPNDKLSAAINYLENKGLIVELLGYLKHADE